MSLGQRLLSKIRLMMGADTVNPATKLLVVGPGYVDPEKALDAIGDTVVRQNALIQVLIAEREEYRKALCGIAWEFGQTGGQLSDLVNLTWAPDPEPQKPGPRPVVEVVKPGAVSLH